MNRRKLQLIALATGLTITALVSLSSWLSWQPHVTKFAPLSREELAQTRTQRTDFFWRESGLMLSRRAAPRIPATARNWNGATLALRSLSARRLDLDAAGEMAARVTAPSGASETQIWDVADARVTSLAVSRVLREATEFEQFGQQFVAISPDGTRVAGSFSSDKNNGVRILDARSGKTLAQFVAPARLIEKQYFLENHKMVEKPLGPEEICALAWAPDNRQLAVVGLDQIWILDGKNARVMRKWRKTDSSTDFARWSPNGKYLGLASGGNSGNIGVPAVGQGTRTAISLTIYQARNGRIQFGWAQNVGSNLEIEGVTNFDFSPDETQLVWGTWRGDVLRTALATRIVEFPYPAYESDNKDGRSAPSVYVAFAPDGATLAIAAPDRITLWRTR